jgi:archaeosine synthase
MHMVTELVEWLLKNNSFDRVVINLPDELDFVKNAVGKAGAQYIDVCTDGERPAEHETVIRLAKCLREAVSGMQRVPMRDAIISSMVSMARFQFGPDIGEELLRGTEFRGRYPYLKFFRGGRQVCSYSPDRDMFALTPEGGKTLMEKGSFFVSIDDFKPHGDIMAVGILDADPVIRVGDEVVIVNKDKTGFIGTGIARMSPSEMLSCKRGVAVKTRSLAEGLGEG